MSLTDGLTHPEEKMDSEPSINDRGTKPLDEKDSAPPARPVPFPIVGIGASAGGLEAFTELLKNLPQDTGMGFVLIQHLAPQHESMLTQVLARATQLPVTEVTDGMSVEANHVYVIPPNTDLAISSCALQLVPRTSHPGPQLPIDHFFASMAEDRRTKATGVGLSGNASDGILTLKAAKSRRARVKSWRQQ